MKYAEIYERAIANVESALQAPRNANAGFKRVAEVKAANVIAMLYEHAANDTDPRSVVLAMLGAMQALAPLVGFDVEALYAMMREKR